jgi:spore coat polysaccharide biosynthesis protein SpsF
MGSTRLPGKVLAPLAGEPAIVRMMERVRRVARAGSYVVATSDHSSDDPLVGVCADRGLQCVRGAMADVLDRVVAAVPPGCDVVVRLTGDCPLVDPGLVDQHIERFDAEHAAVDYVSNAVSRTYPDGLDVEVMSLEILRHANRQATDAYDREHVTPWIQRHARTATVRQEPDLSALRWVLDTPADYECLSAIYDVLLPEDSTFDSRAVYRLQASRPDLVRTAGGISVDDIVERIRTLLAGKRLP